MLSTEEKNEIMEKFGLHGEDTGSSPVQIALLTEKIDRLTEHLKEHPKDNHSRRGLLKMVAKRKKLLDYLKRQRPEYFEEFTEKLGINE
jgi:small subunit ribosomal protein S15